jgi:predicted GTPase
MIEMVRRVIVMGAAGRDFHNFNTYLKNNENYEVVNLKIKTLTVRKHLFHIE